MIDPQNHVRTTGEENLSIEVTSLLIRGQRLSQDLLEQIPQGRPIDTVHRRIAGTLLGTVNCPLSQYALPLWNCPNTAHRHVLWQRGDGLLCCWTITEGWQQKLRSRVQHHWATRRLQLDDLLALVLSLDEEPYQPLPGKKVKLGAYTLSPSPPVSLLLQQLEQVRSIHECDLPRFHLHVAQSRRLDASFEDEAPSLQMLAALIAANVLLERLTAYSVRIVHPLLQDRKKIFQNEGCVALNEEGDVAPCLPDGTEQPRLRGEKLYLFSRQPVMGQQFNLLKEYFWPLRVLLAKNAIHSLLSQIEREARMLAEQVKAGPQAANTASEEGDDPLRQVSLPDAASLYDQYMREREEHRDWMARPEELEMTLRALPHFFLQRTAMRGWSANTAFPLATEQSLLQGPSDVPLERDVEGRNVSGATPEMLIADASGDYQLLAERLGIPWLPGQPGRQERINPLDLARDMHDAHMPPADQGRETEGRGTALMPPIWAHRPAGQRQPIGLHLRRPAGTRSDLVAVIDPLLVLLLITALIFSLLFFLGWMAPLSSSQFASLALPLALLYGGLGYFDRICRHHLVIFVQARLRRSAIPLPTRIICRSQVGRLPLAGGTRITLFGFTYLGAYLLWTQLFLKGAGASSPLLDQLLFPLATLIWIAHVYELLLLALTRVGAFFWQRVGRSVIRRE
jgi:hypothetical protein